MNNQEFQPISSKRLIDLTVADLESIIREEVKRALAVQPGQDENEGEDDLYYGLDGISMIFNCSKPTAMRIKNSGKIDGAITQVGRKIVINKRKALELARR